MCVNFWSWDWTTANLSFAQLANVQTVGIGLYLALAVIQAVSSTGIAGLARRVSTLRSAVASSRLGSVEAANVRSLSGEVSGLEIGFQRLHRAILWSVFILFDVAVFYFAYCTIWQNLDAGTTGIWFIFAYYLALPVFIFGWSTTVIARRCRDVSVKVDEAEKRVTRALLKL